MAKTHTETTGIDPEALDHYVGHVARLMQQQKDLTERISKICATADEAGLATRREIRKLARESLMQPDDLDAELTRMQELRNALRSFAATPLGAAAISRAETVVKIRLPHDPSNPFAPLETSIPEYSGQAARKPRPFSGQTIHDPDRPRGRRRRSPAEALFDPEPGAA